MKSKIVVILFFLVKISIAQNAWELDTTIQTTEATQVYADHLGNVYLVNKWNITKLNEKFEQEFIYNNPASGDITYLNVFNPFNVLVYYRDYNYYEFLDNKLNRNLNRFAPANAGFFDVQLTATFDNNNVWFYDQVSDKIYKWSLTQNGEISSSLQINQLAGNEKRPNFLYATLKNVYLNIPDIGILVFDNFGSYQRTIPIAGLKSFFLSNSSLVFINEQSLEWFNDFTKTSIKSELPLQDFDDLFFADDKLYILKEGELSVYK